MMALRHAARWGCCTLFLWTATGAHLGIAQETPPPARPPSAPGPETPINSAPQPGRVRPQAQTPEEAAAYQAFLDQRDPDQRIRLVEDFLLAYPETQLKEYAFQVAMQAYQAKDDLEHMLTYGDMVLGENPDNITALLSLATAISEMTARSDAEREERLADGDQYARQALEVLGRLRRPPGFPEEQWNDARRESESVAHAAHGLMALIREDFVRAELELKEAVALARNPDPALLYRLGMSYSFQKKYAEALEVLDRAASLGGIKIATSTGSARDIVAEAREFASKALAGAAPPPATAPPASPSSAGDAQPGLIP